MIDDMDEWEAYLQEKQVEYLPRSVEKTPDLVIGSMALRKEDNEFSRRRYINAYAAAVYDDHAQAV